jgi:arylsulfatase A-like enzyme
MSQPKVSRSQVALAWGYLLLAALAPPLLVRLVLRLESDVPTAGADIYGVLSDLGAALLCGVALLACARLSRVLAVVLALLWSLLNYASFEHIRELGSALQFTFAHYATDPTFLLGSALAPTNPLLLGVLAIGAPLCAWGLTRQPAARPRVWPPLLAGVALLGTLSAIPVDRTVLSWRQRNFLNESLERALRFGPSSPLDEIPGEAPPSAFRADLDGVARVGLPVPGMNILLLVLEGLPPTSVDHITAVSGKWPMRLMPELSLLAEENVLAPNFVLHQRQTNRGLYAMLCGDYPKLGHALARMSEYAHDGRRGCLPDILKKASYRTVYLQAAPLSFMYKDPFMKNIGFDEVYGNRHFDEAIARSAWGVDDRTLFLRTREIVERLQAGEEPWFLTVLTVGTHQPVTLPEEARAQSILPIFWKAALYLDAALGELLAALREQGVLDETLVIIAPDESRGSQLDSDLSTAISQNWGPLVVLLPSRESMVLGEPVAQSDLALSIVDYLGIDHSETSLIGRSIFRRYQTPRRIYFSNAYQRNTGGLDSRGFVYWCDESAESCARYRSQPTSPFIPASDPEELSAEELRELRRTVAYSLRSELAGRRELEFTLIGDPVVPLLATEEQFLMDGQNLHIPAKSLIQVDVALSLQGGRGEAHLSCMLSERGHDPYYRTELPPIHPGDRVSLQLRSASLTPIKNLKFRIHSVEPEGEGMAVHFTRAKLRVEPLADDRLPESSRLIDEPELRVVRAEAGEG